MPKKQNKPILILEFKNLTISQKHNPGPAHGVKKLTQLRGPKLYNELNGHNLRYDQANLSHQYLA